MSWSAPAPGHRRLSRFTTGRRALRAGAIATAVAAMLCTYIVVVVTRADAASSGATSTGLGAVGVACWSGTASRPKR